ncbi:DUF4215 domain-containing protein [Nannocystis pusilla]|uniref:DUF4215 domain-containing protein n=1 Tax=Nannocystis pusilla TaxID=889268 RepID=A0ABS7TSA2_9BACT|nr:DUF4215 domain-containing protein [Nannocystis pusilla]MBZ5711119.1 DUF4215 domain-containing protein [Nannocystis pusilla]
MNTRFTTVLLLTAIVPACFYNPEVPHSAGTTEAITTDTTAASEPTSTTDGTAVCGDGKTEGAEQCDDGNDVAGDGCENDCTATPGTDCGDGILDPGEECDDGNKVAMDGCENNCTETVSASCGDGLISGDEECDDGNDDDTDECLSTCRAASCGDAHVQMGVEACDNGEQNSDSAYDGCTTQCELGPRCGDGVVQEAEGEQCDDSTPDGDDLCNNCIATPYRYIFVTSLTFKGDLNKFSGSDIKCAAAADSASIPLIAKWKAWLSDSAESPTSRMDTTFNGWYVLPGPEPVLVARGWAGLTSGMLLHPVNRDEFGNPIAAEALVWTNTDLEGKILSLDAHCNNWDSNTGFGNTGDPNAINEMWTHSQSKVDCNTPHHLYCIQN